MSSHARHNTRTLWLVGALHAFTHVYYVALIPLYLLVQRDFQFTSVGQATSLVTVQMIAYFVPSYLLGMLADRVSRKKLLGYGLVINGLGYVALALSPNYACACAAVILAGIGGSFYHPAATAMIARLYPVNTGRALGLIGVGASVGFFIGPLYSGWRAASLEAVRGAAAWRVPILELGLLGIVAAGIFAWLAHEEQPSATIEVRGAARSPIFPTTTLWVWFIACAFAFSLRDFAGAGMGTMSSLFLQKAHGYDARLAGLALSVLFIVSAISNPLFGHLSDRGRKRWTASVTLIGALLMASFPLMPGAWLIPCLAAYGFFFMSGYPMVEAELMQSVPDAVRGRVFGLFITVGGLVGNLSHWIVGTQVKRMGEAAQSVAAYQPLYVAIAVLTVLSLLGLPCLHAIRKREHLEPSPSAAGRPIANRQ